MMATDNVTTSFYGNNTRDYILSLANLVCFKFLGGKKR